MSGTEFAREKERVAAIMKEKQAKGEYLALSSGNILSVHFEMW